MVHSVAGRTLVAYFSHSGNTRRAAEQIQQRIGGDIFEIRAVDAYPSQYGAVVDQAKREQQANLRPELTGKVQNMDSYDVIFIGYPNWWGTMPMPVFTFFEEHDFAGKTIVPFCTHEGSRMGRSVKDIATACPGATVLEGVDIRGSEVQNARVAETVLALLQSRGS